MKNLFLLVVVPCLAALSCATVDYGKTVSDSGPGPVRDAAAAAEIFLQPPPAPEIIIVERPVYVPASEAPPQKTPAGEQAVRASNREGIVRPEDYSHAAMVYAYNPDCVYEVYAQPLRVCDIVLRQGERAVEPPFVSDSERWILGAGVSYENGAAVQHIYVKPASAGLEASLVINTDARAYHIILRSFRDVHMPIVRWTYPSLMPNSYVPAPPVDSGAEDSLPGVNPRRLSFNYRVTYGLFSKPYWLPSLVFDDGSKTFITFPDAVLQRELPSVFENRNDVVNYRVAGNLIVINKLVENITVKIGRNEITVAKKK
jgi:type IV secretion system protein VirB9